MPQLAAATAEVELPWTPIGFSQGGQPLVLRHFGDAKNRVLILGGQHGAPEANTIRLVEQLTEHFVSTPGEVPGTIGLDILAITNPDGTAAGIAPVPERRRPESELGRPGLGARRLRLERACSGEDWEARRRSRSRRPAPWPTGCWRTGRC